jgi:3-hydroxybutyryl-CoA dehydrogenase
MINNVTIIGSGLMGHGIALKFAQFGFGVTVFDPNEGSLNTLFDRINRSLSQMSVPASKIKKILSSITKSSKLLESVQKAELIIEAVPEKLELKQKIFREIETLSNSKCIFASNTSVIPITKIVEKMHDKSRALGTHWWNPPHLIPLVEVIRTKWTAEKHILKTIDVLNKIDKTPVRVEKDVPGFIGNRLQHALWREAISLVENGVCDAKSVDTVIKSSFGRRLSVLGPLENADLVGTDLTLDVHENVLYDLESSNKPSKLLKNLVKSGKLGMKSGEGFQQWDNKDLEQIKLKISKFLSELEKII